MISTTSSLPDGPEKLKQIIAEYESELELLREQVAHLYSHIFGPKSEKLGRSESPQLPLFDLPEPSPEAEVEADSGDEVAVTSHTRKKKGRQPLLDKLPRIEQLNDLPKEEKVCHCGAQLSRIGEEVLEKLDIIPAVIQAIRHIRPKYSCKQCENVDEKGASVKAYPSPMLVICLGRSAQQWLIATAFIGLRSLSNSMMPFVGGKRTGQKGRGAVGKKPVLVAIETREKSAGFAAMQAVAEKHFHEKITPPEQAYNWLPLVHLMIGNMKTFINRTFHRVSSKYLQDYLDEFCYRFNRRLWEPELPLRLLNACLAHVPGKIAEFR